MKRPTIARIVAIFLGMLVLYPLSIGPAIYLDRKLRPDTMDDSSARFGHIYIPLFMLYGRNRAYDRVFDWYTDLWWRQSLPKLPPP